MHIHQTDNVTTMSHSPQAVCRKNNVSHLLTIKACISEMLANSADPDQTAPEEKSDLVYTVCSSMVVQKLFMVNYCKTLNICGIKISRVNEKGHLAHFNFGGHDTLWLQIKKKI